MDQEDGMVLHAYEKRQWFHGAHRALKNVATDDNYWHQLVEIYSRRQLTQHSDKLPALSGIANAISTVRIGDTYLAGLCKDSLSFDLTWRTQCGEWADSTKPLEYRAPSWSWASVDGTIEHTHYLKSAGSENSTIAFDAAEAKVEPKGHSPFGQVRNGSLTLSGFLFEATFLGSYTRWTTPLFDGGTPFGNFFPDTGNDVHAKRVTCLKLLDLGSIWDEVFLVLVPAAGGCFEGLVFVTLLLVRAYDILQRVSLERWKNRLSRSYNGLERFSTLLAWNDTALTVLSSWMKRPNFIRLLVKFPNSEQKLA